jgi:hypothetical protein
LSPGRGEAIRTAMDFKPTGARGLRELLNFLEECLSELVRVAAGLPLEAGTPQEAEFLRSVVDRWDLHPASVPLALETVDRARALAAGNVNPQLVIFGLLHDLRETLTPAAVPPEPER